MPSRNRFSVWVQSFLSVQYLKAQISQNWLEWPISNHTPLKSWELELSNGVWHVFGELGLTFPLNFEGVACDPIAIFLYPLRRGNVDDAYSSSYHVETVYSSRWVTTAEKPSGTPEPNTLPVLRHRFRGQRCSFSLVILQFIAGHNSFRSRLNPWGRRDALRGKVSNVSVDKLHHDNTLDSREIYGHVKLLRQPALSLSLPSSSWGQSRMERKLEETTSPSSNFRGEKNGRQVKDDGGESVFPVSSKK